MANDPAFLFYTGDFVTGTQFFTDAQVGVYIRLLMAQHQHGHLSEKQFKHICTDMDVDVVEKFENDADGKFFNKRLDDEIIKRKKHSENQKINISKRWNKQPVDLVDTNDIPNEYQNDTMVIPLENRNENENEDIIKKESKIEISKSVLVTASEFEKLKEKFGHGFLWAVEKLSNYKLSSGKMYKSDYHALIGWVYDQYIKEKTNINGNKPTIAGTGISATSKFAKDFIGKQSGDVANSR